LVDLNCSGGNWALASLPMVANYPIIGERLTLSSPGDAALYLYFSIANFHNTTIQNGGRANIRIRMTDLVMEG
jgi:hypothetical protein